MKLFACVEPSVFCRWGVLKYFITRSWKLQIFKVARKLVKRFYFEIEFYVARKMNFS